MSFNSFTTYFKLVDIPLSSFAYLSYNWSAFIGKISNLVGFEKNAMLKDKDILLEL